MQNDFLNSLNSEQKEAVLATDGPMIVLAGAGSGKTRVLTFKVLYLISQRIANPEDILMVTFTNKAANEMKERIEKYIREENLQTGTSPLVATFHSLCAKILRIDGKYVGLSQSYVIYDEQDQKDAIKEVFKLLNLSIKEYKPASVLATISQAKNELISANEYLNYAKGHFQQIVAKVYVLYQKLLLENNALDFDDLLLKTVELFTKNPQVLEKYKDKFKYILVDEYQDTNHAQYILTKMLASKWNNICVVGDFSQSIYSWRGADFQNLIKFKDDFKNVKTFNLSQNYRSTQKILDASYAVISKNSTHPVLELWTENQGGEEIVLFEARNEHNEAEFILEQIASLKYQQPDLKFSDIAILYRTNAQSRVIEEVFIHHSLPYVLIGGTRFYDRKEIKDILAYLRLLANEKDSVSKKRIEKLGKGRFEKFLEFKDKANSENATLELMDNVIKSTGYLSLYDEKDEEDLQRLENIKELRSVAIEFPNLNNFLENVALVEQEYMPDHPQKDRTKKNAVNFMTLHAAKGLEFSVVFIVGMEEGLFPHSRTLMDKNELEEERRLCYVGMTRAKHKLYLTYSRKRLFFGQTANNMVSRFVFDLPETILLKNVSLLDRRDDVPEYL
jgi:DNA helicase II / ATP-dependent DNA helicase PcrA